MRRARRIGRRSAAGRVGTAAVGTLVTLLMLPPAAWADRGGLRVHRPLAGPKSVEDVRGYWTRERMREAAPRGPAVGDGVGATDQAGAASGSGARASAVEQPNTTSYPHRVVGKVFYTQPGQGDFACSGSVINTDTDAFVLTARHCVEDGGVFATNWMFVPGYRNGAKPFGGFVATELRVPSFPAFFSLAHDHAAAIVAPSASGQSVEDAVGAFGVALFERARQEWRAYGYPAGAPFDGERLFTCDSMTAATDTALAPAPVGITCEMTGGASGGPWVIRAVLVASNSSYLAPQDFPGLLFGPRFDRGAAELLDSAHPVRCGGAIPTIVGTEGPDRLVGTRRRDVILGDRGRDVIVGKGRKDRLCGEEGKDKLKGGRGKDLCDGGRSRDKGRGCEKKKRI